MNDRQRAVQILRGAGKKGVKSGLAGTTVIVSDGAVTQCYPEFAGDVDPHILTFWMLGSHIQHVKASAEAAGGNVTMEKVAEDAISFIREYTDAEDAGI